jgi:TrmH family RNA methyltransferase
MSRHSTWAGAVEDVRRALAPKGRAQLGQFVVEGTRLVERALRAGVVPSCLVISDRILRQHEPRTRALLKELERTQCEVVAVPEGVVLELAEGRNGGILFALCSVPKSAPLQELRARAESEHAPLLVLVDVEEPGNVGALVRTALAAGAVGLVAVGLSDPYHPKAVRTSMGSLFKLPLSRAAGMEPLLDALAGLPKVAAVAEGGQAPWRLPLARGHALFVGKESAGLPVALIEHLELRASIPMPSGVDSFSVNAAAAVILCEAMRQRTS